MEGNGETLRSGVKSAAATVAFLGTMIVLEQLRDSTSWLRLRLAEAGELGREAASTVWARYSVHRLISDDEED